MTTKGNPMAPPDVNPAPPPPTISDVAGQLERQLRANEDPKYRQELVATLAPRIQELAGQLASAAPELEIGGSLLSPNAAKRNDALEASVHDALASLSRVARLVRPEAVASLVDAFARGLPDASLGFGSQGRLGQELRDAMVNGANGSTFAVGIASALQVQGKAKAAGEVLESTASALKEVRERFDTVHAAVVELTDQLAGWIRGFGPGMSPRQLQAAIQSFKDRHAAQYAAWEEQSARLGAMFDGAADARSLAKADSDLSREATLALSRANRLVHSNAGSELLRTALAAQGRGERTFLDVLPAVARELSALGDSVAKRGLDPEAFRDGGAGWLQSLGESMARCLTPKLLELRADGQDADAAALVATAVQRNPQLFGMDPAEVGRVGAVLETIARAETPAALQQALSAFQGKPSSAPDTRGQQVFKALGFAFAAAGFYKKVKTAKETGELADVLRAASSGASLTSKGFALAASLLKQPADSALSVASVAFSRVSGALGAIASGVQGVEEIKRKEYWDAGTDILSGIGEALSIIPGGQLAGTIVSVVAFGAHFIITQVRKHKKDTQAEADLHAFLQAGGFPPKVADLLSNQTGDGQNVGDVLLRMARYTGLSRRNVLRYLEGLPDAPLNALRQTIEPHFHRLLDKYDHAERIPEEDIAQLAKQLQAGGILPAG